MYSGYRNELFRYLSLDEEDVLKKAKELLMQPEKAMIDNDNQIQAFSVLNLYISTFDGTLAVNIGQ